jgi:hypothetical protein
VSFINVVYDVKIYMLRIPSVLSLFKNMYQFKFSEQKTPGNSQFHRSLEMSFLTTRLPSLHPSGTCILEVAPKVLKILWTCELDCKTVCNSAAVKM